MFATLALEPACADDSKDIVARILADWKTRQDQIQSIQVELSGTHFHPRGQYDEDVRRAAGDEALRKIGHLPTDDVSYPLTTRYALHLDNNWARKDLDWMIMCIDEESEFQRRRTSHLFDGKQIRVYEPRQENTNSTYTPPKTQPELILQARGFKRAFFYGEDAPVLWGCGIVPIGAVDLERLRSVPDQHLFWFKGYGEIQGRRCLVLRTRNLSPKTEMAYEFWIDAEQGSSVVRSQKLISGEVDSQIDAEWKQVGQRWFPKHWRFSYYHLDPDKSNLVYSFEMEVERVTFNPALERSFFEVKLKPGMVVQDVVQDSHGVIGADGTSLLPLSEIDAIDRSLRIRRILTWAAAAVLFLLAAWYIRRRWASRGAA
jgi:hypothetical protein